jgi:L-ribulose-5-phosphate 3-epimerase
MNGTRRTWLLRAAGAGVVLPAAWAAKSKLKIGVTDWNLRMTGKPEAVALAASLGFQGIEVSLGRKVAGDKLPLADTSLQQQYREAFAKAGIGPSATCLDVLHVNYLKNDPLGKRWVSDGIGITKSLGAPVMLLPFFGKGALETKEEKDALVETLKPLAEEARKAGVILGLENTISAEDNIRILDAVRNPSVKVFYDVGNSTNGGFDVAAELKKLGPKRLCLIHLKDNPGYLGEGKIGFPEVINVIVNLGFNGFCDLETDSPSKSVDADMKRNLTYVRGLIQKEMA